MRGGRAKRFYRLTPRGMGQLAGARRALLQMWDGLDAVLDNR